MFKQPCLIKKNTKALRKQIEELGYLYAPLKSNNPSYDNTKEPWIVCAYNIYLCVDNKFFKGFERTINEFEPCYTSDSDLADKDLARDIKKFEKNQEHEFLETIKILA